MAQERAEQNDLDVMVADILHYCESMYPDVMKVSTTFKRSLRTVITQRVTILSQASERAVWEEAAAIADNIHQGGHYHFPTLAAEFRQKGTESSHAV